MMATMTSSKIRLSPSALNLFLDCRRCFWLDRVKGIKRPRGPYPTLPSGMDRVIKVYFDSFRLKGELPPELQVEGFRDIQLFPDQAKLDAWREWRTGLEFTDVDGSSLGGAVDDLLVKGDQLIPLDYKTKGSPTSVESAVKYYQNQLNCYGLLLHENHFPLAGYGFLFFYSPKALSEGPSARFQLQAIKVRLEIETARDNFRLAVGFLKGPLPKIENVCEYCAWARRSAQAPEEPAGF